MNDTTLPKKLRRKTGVKKGFALHDWKLLLNRSADLAQRKGAPLRSMTMEEVAQHDKEYDGWMVLHGKVYNIGPYIPYHPGGAGIMKPSLGKDGSSLFEQYHRWVGIENLIGKMLIGYIDDSPQSQMSMPPPKPGLQKLDNLLDEKKDEKEESVNPWEK